LPHSRFGGISLRLVKPRSMNEMANAMLSRYDVIYEC
jgi:hypothetical protein